MLIWTVCSLLTTTLCAAVTPFNPSYVSLVLSGENYLFRGSLPQDEEGVFLKATLKETLAKKAAARGVLLPDDYYLSIISLLTLEREEEALFLHRYLSQSKRQKAQLIDGICWTWWQVRAHFAKPQSWEALFEQQFDGEYLAFPRLVEWVEKLYTTHLDKPHVVYVHCRHGRNRTTATIAALLMRLCGMSLEEVWPKVTVPEMYEPHEMYHFLTAYAEYLEHVRGTSPQNTRQKTFVRHRFVGTIGWPEDIPHAPPYSLR